MLFEALWVHGLDLDDVEVVRGLTTDAWWSRGTAGAKPLIDGRSLSDLIDQPLPPLRRLRQRWRDELSVMRGDVLPVLVVDGEARLHGGRAVSWLGDEVARRGACLDEAASCRAMTSEHPAASTTRPA